MSLFRAAAAFCSAWHMRLAPRTIRLGPWYAGKRPRPCLFGIFGGGPLALSRAASQLGPATKRSPETTDRDSAQRWPRRNPYALCMSVRDSESRTARVSVATVAVVAMASGRDAVAAEANIRGKRRGYLRR